MFVCSAVPVNHLLDEESREVPGPACLEAEGAAGPEGGKQIWWALISLPSSTQSLLPNIIDGV